jgi:hypothetical protein
MAALRVKAIGRPIVAARCLADSRNCLRRDG